MKLDYTLTSPEERLELVNKILEETPDPNPAYLEILGDYLVLCMEKQEKKERKLLTDNRMDTILKRETSFEGLVSQFENGEDGIYNLVTNDKNVIFKPKVAITKKDIEEIPELRQLREAIEVWEQKLKKASGREAYVIKKAIIDLRKDQYLIKDSYHVPISLKNLTHSRSYIPFNETIELDEEGYAVPIGISLINPIVCSEVLCNYSRLKEEAYGNFEKDTWYFMQDFDRISTKALQNYPLYERLVELKIDGRQGIDIQEILLQEFGIKHSLEYISSLWRKKIPGMIASIAEDEYLDWYYLNIEKGKYKRCSKCGQIKLAHNKYFSKNKTSKDGFYSICKACRNKKVVPLVKIDSSN